MVNVEGSAKVSILETSTFETDVSAYHVIVSAQPSGDNRLVSRPEIVVWMNSVYLIENDQCLFPGSRNVSSYVGSIPCYFLTPCYLRVTDATLPV